MRNACRILFFLILGIIVVRTDVALSFEFITINDFWPEKKGISYGMQEDYITIPGRGGIISDFPISFNIGTVIELSLSNQVSDSAIQKNGCGKTVLTVKRIQSNFRWGATIKNISDSTGWNTSALYALSDMAKGDMTNECI